MKDPESATGSRSLTTREALHIGAARVVPRERTITASGQQHRIDHKAMQVLLCLVDRAGQLVEKQTIFGEVWPEQAVSDDVLPVAIRTLRRALGDDAKVPLFIETVPRSGYRLIATVNPAQSSARARRVVWLLAVVALLLVLLSVFAWRSSPSDRPKLLSENEQANRAYERGRYLARGTTAQDRSSAFDELSRAIEADPKFASAHADLAGLQLARWLAGELDAKAAEEAATQSANRALELDPSSIAAHRALGVTNLLLSWDQPVAESHFDQALELDPRDSETLFWSVQYSIGQRRFDEALELTRRLVGLEPDTYERDWEAYILNLQRKHHLALERLEEQRELVSCTKELDLQTAATYVWLERPDQAAPFYRSYLEKSNTPPQVIAEFDLMSVAPTVESLLRFHLGQLERTGARPVDLAQVHRSAGQRRDRRWIARAGRWAKAPRAPVSVGRARLRAAFAPTRARRDSSKNRPSPVGTDSSAPNLRLRRPSTTQLPQFPGHLSQDIAGEKPVTL